MTELQLDFPPAGLRPAAHEGWLQTPTTDPEPGELWLLGWDRETPAAAMITAVREGYVLAMPVTFDPAEAGGNEVVIDADLLGIPTVVWNRAETGLGTFLLRRRVGAMVPNSYIQPLRQSFFSGTPEPRFVHGTGDATARFTTLATEFAALCFVEWPSASNGDQVLDIDVLENAGVDARKFADRTGFDPPSVLALWSQERIRPEQLDAVRAALGDLAAEAIVAPGDVVITELQRPRWKDSIIQIAHHRHLDERAARELVRTDVALAARTDSLADRHRTAVGDAVARLLQG
jgi:hypothetical protein